MLPTASWITASALVIPVAFAVVTSGPVVAEPGGPSSASADPSPDGSASPGPSTSPSLPESPGPSSPPSVPVPPGPSSPPSVPVPPGPSTSPSLPQPTPTESPSTELLVERSLAALGLPTGKVDGRYTRTTRRALCAFRDLNGLTATRRLPSRRLSGTIVSATDLPRFPRGLRGVRAAVSLTCQTTYVAKRTGAILRVLPVSTGKDNGFHRTRRGFKRVYYKVNRWQASSLFPEPDGRPGLYRPVYFDRGIAFHGVRARIQTFPQSHGCVRTWPKQQDWLYKRLKVRDRVFVYGDYWRGRSAPLGGYGR